MIDNVPNNMDENFDRFKFLTAFSAALKKRSIKKSDKSPSIETRLATEATQMAIPEFQADNIVNLLSTRNYKDDLHPDRLKEQIETIDHEIDDLYEKYTDAINEITQNQGLIKRLDQNLLGYADVIFYRDMENDFNNPCHTFFKLNNKSLKALVNNESYHKVLDAIRDKILVSIYKDAPVGDFLKHKDEFIKLCNAELDKKKADLKKISDKIIEKQEKKKDKLKTYYEISNGVYLEIFKTSDTTAEIRIITTKKNLTNKDVREIIDGNFNNLKSCEKPPSDITEILHVEIDATNETLPIQDSMLRSGDLISYNYIPNISQIVGEMFNKQSENINNRLCEYPVGSGKSHAMAQAPFYHISFIPRGLEVSFKANLSCQPIIFHTSEESVEGIDNNHQLSISSLRSSDKNTKDLEAFIKFKDQSMNSLAELLLLAPELEDKEIIKTIKATYGKIKNANFDSVPTLLQEIDVLSDAIRKHNKFNPIGETDVRDENVNIYVNEFKTAKLEDLKARWDRYKNNPKEDEEETKALNDLYSSIQTELENITSIKNSKKENRCNPAKINNIISDFNAKAATGFKISPQTARTFCDTIGNTPFPTNDIQIKILMGMFGNEFSAYNETKRGYKEYQKPPSAPMLKEISKLGDICKTVESNKLTPAQLCAAALKNDKVKELGYKIIISYPKREQNNDLTALINDGYFKNKYVSVDEAHKLHHEYLYGLGGQDNENQVKILNLYTGTANKVLNDFIHESSGVSKTIEVYRRTNLNTQISVLEMPEEEVGKQENYHDIVANEVSRTLFSNSSAYYDQGHTGDYTNSLTEDNIQSIVDDILSYKLHSDYKDTINKLTDVNASYEQKLKLINTLSIPGGNKSSPTKDLFLYRYLTPIINALKYEKIDPSVYANNNHKKTFNQKLQKTILMFCNRSDNESLNGSNILLNTAVEFKEEYLPNVESELPSFNTVKYEDDKFGTEDIAKLDDSKFRKNQLQYILSLIEKHKQKKSMNSSEYHYILEAIQSLQSFELTMSDDLCEDETQFTKVNDKVDALIAKSINTYIKNCSSCENVYSLATMNDIVTHLNNSLKRYIDTQLGKQLTPNDLSLFKNIFSRNVASLYSEKSKFKEQIFDKIAKYKYPRYIEKIMQKDYYKIKQNAKEEDIPKVLFPMISEECLNDMKEDILALDKIGLGHNLIVFERKARRDLIDLYLIDKIFKDVVIGEKEKNQLMDELRAIMSTQCSPELMLQQLKTFCNEKNIVSITKFNKKPELNIDTKTIEDNINKIEASEIIADYQKKFRENINDAKSKPLALNTFIGCNRFEKNPDSSYNSAQKLLYKTKCGNIASSMTGFSLQSVGNGIYVYPSEIIEKYFPGVDINSTSLEDLKKTEHYKLLESDVVQSLGRTLRQEKAINHTKIRVLVSNGTYKKIVETIISDNFFSEKDRDKLSITNNVFPVEMNNNGVFSANDLSNNKFNSKK